MTTVELPALPSIVAGRVGHRRYRPFRHDVGFRTALWLIDLDDVPSYWPVATFRPRDHLDRGTDETWRERAIGLAAEHGATSAAVERVVALVGARSFGYVFDPLTVYWALSGRGDVEWVLYEVHNTFGGRHVYLIEGDAGWHDVVKDFYVSPFIPLTARYRTRVSLTPRAVGVDVNVDDAEGRLLATGFHGRPRPASWPFLLRTVIRSPLSMHQTTLRIHLHGIRLWLRRLPVMPRRKEAGNVPH